MSRTVLLPMADRQVQRWKNGGGTTTEIAIFPPDAGQENFDWRISMASVTVPGEFSHFGGIDRILAVIEGELELTFVGDTRTVCLTLDSPPHAFPGEARVVGTPVGGHVFDLNLMTRRGRWTGTMERVPSPCSISLTSSSSIILFAHEGHLRWRGKTVPMRALDAICIDSAKGETVDLAGNGCVYVMSVAPVAA
jgi:environmental stress-induced protein Ves